MRTSEQNREYAKHWRRRNPDKWRAIVRRTRKKHIDKVRALNKRHFERLKNKIYDHYGRLCASCGFSDIRALSIDHIHNDGAEHRKKVGKGSVFYRWLISNQFPSDFQVLCMNCQFIKERNRV